MSVEVPEGWHVQSINEFSEVVSGSTPDTSNSRYWNGDIIWITPDDLSKNEQVYVNESARRISNLGLKNSSAQIIPRNSIVMSSRAPIGYLAIVTSDYTTNQGCKSLRLRNSVIPEFVYYALLFNMDKIKQKGEGTTFAEISKKELEGVSILLPKSLPEQKKIASILQCVGNAIGKTKELIEKDKKMKQGLTQSLFDAKRLTGTERKLSECCIFIRDGTHGSYEDSENGIPLLSAKDVVYGKIIRDNNPRRISLRDYYSIHSKYELKEGDVVLTIVGTIGRSAVLRKLTEKFTFQRSVAILRPKKEVNSSYLYHYTNTFKFQKNLEMAVNASAQGGVYLGALNKMPIVIPDEPKSQAEIVSILDSIDEKIDIERSYLDKLAKIKSGLMQDLLTGKVRVAA